MTPHLPYAFSDDDEFHHPVSGWLLLDRSITFDNWLSWRHALPGDRRGFGRLTAAVSEAIITIAAAIHQAHQRFPGYQRLDRSPFIVPRWWDPFADDGWESGRFCLFRVDGHSSRDFMDHWIPGESNVVISMASDSHLEAELPIGSGAAGTDLHRGAEHLPPPAGRRKRRSPPPGRSARQPLVQLLEP